MKVRARPYDFPITGDLAPKESALLIIDMQRDFCDPLGYMGSRGGDVSAARAIIPKIQAVRDAAKRAGFRIFHTREGHRPDLSDLPEQKRLKTALSGAEIGSDGPLGKLLVRGEPGWQIVEELTPAQGEIVIDKPGTGAFYGTDLHHVLSNYGIRNLVLVGVTTGVCVNSTAREANDRGYNVLVLGDCCAEPNRSEHEIALRLLGIEGGYLATIALAAEFLEGTQVSANQTLDGS